MTERHNKATVLFVCVSNAGKSVMAQALMQQAAADTITALSAGTHAKTAVNPVSAEALAELGINVSAHRPTQLDARLVDDADLVVVLGAEADVDHYVERARVERWVTDEPSHRGIDGIQRMRLIRDDIATRVADLAERLAKS